MSPFIFTHFFVTVFVLQESTHTVPSVCFCLFWNASETDRSNCLYLFPFKSGHTVCFSPRVTQLWMLMWCCFRLSHQGLVSHCLTCMIVCKQGSFDLTKKSVWMTMLQSAAVTQGHYCWIDLKNWTETWGLCLKKIGWEVPLIDLISMNVRLWSLLCTWRHFIRDISPS